MKLNWRLGQERREMGFRVLEQGPGNRGKGRLARGRCPGCGEYDNVIHIIFKCSEKICQILSRKWLNICLNEESA
jgi:hypothetical protein